MFFSSIIGQGRHEALLDSDRDSHCVHLVLECQQAVGNALLVARKTHPNPLDVTVGGEGEKAELGTGLCSLVQLGKWAGGERES